MNVDTPTIFMLNKRLPFDMPDTGSSGMMHLPDGLLVMRLTGLTRADVRMFEGNAKIRVGDFGSFMIICPTFRKFSFDLLWSPVIARKGEEPLLEEMSADEHFLLSLILVDDQDIIRGQRTGTIGPKTYGRILRTQRELLQRNITDIQVARDMERLFSAHPRGIPDELFQARSSIGA